MLYEVITPRVVAKNHINELQEQLLRDDAFIPNRPANDPLDLAKKADEIFATSTSSGDAKRLTDGMSRDFEGDIHHWASEGLPASVQFEWKKPVSLSKVEIKCDTNVKRNLMMLKESTVDETHWNDVPVELMKSLDLEARVKGQWMKVGSIEKNRTRLIKFNFDTVETTAIRINLQNTYGAKIAKLFEVRCYF